MNDKELELRWLFPKRITPEVKEELGALADYEAGKLDTYTRKQPKLRNYNRI